MQKAAIFMMTKDGRATHPSSFCEFHQSDKNRDVLGVRMTKSLLLAYVQEFFY